MIFFSVLFEKIKLFFENERPRWILWAPVALGTGISIYFSLDAEPSIHTVLLLTVLSGICLITLRRHIVAMLVTSFATLVLIGVLASTLRTYFLDTPILNEPLRAGFIKGNIERIDKLPGYTRLVLSHVEHESIHLESPLRKVRISFRGRMFDHTAGFLPGMRIRSKAVLLPPSEPVAPGSYDFRRRAWFEEIGAVGYALGSPVHVDMEKDRGIFMSFQKTINIWRHQLTMAIRHRIPGIPGEIAAALVTGDRSGIPENTRQNYADAGIAHILAISGLHLNIVAGVVFFIFRGILSLIPALSLRYSTKKWGAAAAMIFTFAYLMICGAPVSAQRAFLMTWLVLVGVLADRIALSLRNIALAASVILIFFPESLTSPSFQLSFAAVVALVSVYEALGDRVSSWKSLHPGILWKTCFYILGIILSTMIATLATTPYIIHTFHRFTLHAIEANIISIPLTTFVVMPGLVLMIMLMPLGLDGFLHKILHVTLSGMMDMARCISDWPGSVILVHATGTPTLALLTYGGLMLLLLKTRARLFGIIPVLCGILPFFTDLSPDLYISGDGKTLGFRTSRGELWTPRLRGGKFARESWAKMMGATLIGKLPSRGETTDGEILCDAPVYLFRNRLKIHMDTDNTFRISDMKTGKLVVDPCFLEEHGGTFLQIQPSEILITTTRHPGVSRPWTLN